MLDEIVLIYKNGATARFFLVPKNSHCLKTVTIVFILVVLSAARIRNWSAVTLQCVCP